MYCKNCGKKLPDDARFCDRCNVSVRKKSGKMNLIGELKEERLARRKAKAVEERLKKIKKIRSRRRKIVFLVVLGVIMLGVISGAFMYINYVRNSTFTKPIDNAPVITETPSPTEDAVSGGNPSTSEPSVNRDGYIVSEFGGKKFVYPGNFVLKTDDEATAVYEDATGDAKITVGSFINSSDATATMKQYKTHVTETDAKFGVDGETYYITGSNGDEMYHRFGYIKDGVETYYEFTYPSDSAKKAEYESDIDYMDEQLKRD